MRLLKSNARLMGQWRSTLFQMPRPTMVPAKMLKICQPTRRGCNAGGLLETSHSSKGSSKSPARQAVCAVYTMPGMRPEISRDSRL